MIVTQDVAKDPALTALVDAVQTRRRRRSRTASSGAITADITRAAGGHAAGESALGDVIADAQLEATARRTSAAP